MNKLILSFFILNFFILLASCTHKTDHSPHRSEESANESGDFTVNLDQDNQNDSSEKVEITEGLGSNQHFGPNIEQIDSNITTKPKSKVVGLFIGPVAYESLLSLQAVQSFQSRGQRFHVYSGSGLGFLLATFLAAGKSVDQIEWFFFKIKKELGQYKIYSPEWSEFLIEKSLAFIEVEKIEGLPGSLVFPAFHIKTKKMHYFTKGSIKKYLSLNFSLYSESDYTSALNRYLFPTSGLKAAHSDVIVCLDTLGKKIKFKDIDHYLLGILNRLISLRKNETKSCDHILSINSKMDIDDIMMVDRFRVEENKEIVSQALYIGEKINNEENP